MKVIILGSGSKGNSTLLMDNCNKILIDVGFSYPKMKLLLSKYDLSPSDINGIVVTHTHKDHILGLSSFVKKNHTKVYANNLLYHELLKDIPEDYLCLIDDDFMLDKMHFELIHTSHDAIGSVGFVIEEDNHCLVYITDTGYINESNFSKLKNKDLYIMESNHDIAMLMDGPYPYILKQRIVGDKGHLSNEMAGEYLNDFIGSRTKKIVLIHLSEINNDEKIAVKTIESIMGNKLDHVTLEVAHQEESLYVGEL